MAPFLHGQRKERVAVAIEQRFAADHKHDAADQRNKHASVVRTRNSECGADVLHWHISCQRGC